MKHSADAIQMPVSGLSIGMYVSELDKDWLDSPFLFQGFLIESHEDIDLLEQECQFVWIEPAKGNVSSSSDLNVLKKPKKPKVTYINKVSMPRELENSQSTFFRSRQKTKTIFDEVVLGDAINTEAAKETVQTCVDSILRNPSAMLWLTKLRDSETYTADHSLNVCILAIAFGRQLGYTEEELVSLGMCGLLHDVGKMKIPKEILNKPGKLTENEWNTMKAHTTIGHKLLMVSSGLGQSVDVAHSHHERVDGKGYPRGLEGRQISIYSKIIALCDCFDAMTATRCYSQAKTPTTAVKEIYKSRGTHFDETLALKFIKTIGLYPPGTIVELANGYLAIVLERPEKFQHLPKVLLLRDEKNKPIRKTLVDLSLTKDDKLSRDYLIKRDHFDGYKDIRVADYQDFIASLA